VIVSTGATVDHESVVEDGAHLSPGVRLAGRVHVGRGAWLGLGAAVIDEIRIGARTVVGAGAVVVRDLPPGVVAFGVPARVVREVGGLRR
jgi:acetyltransferase EpsM